MTVSIGFSTGFRTGIELGRYGLLEQLSDYDYHMTIPGIENPYWKVMRENPQTQFFEHYRRGPFEVRIGRLTSFEITYVAELMQSNITRYIDAGLFGRFPVEDGDEKTRLIAAMLSGFNPNQTLISVLDYKRGVIVGGTIINPGMHERKLFEAVGQSDSAVPTLATLNFNPGKFGDLFESEVCGSSRFWRISDGELRAIFPGDKEGARLYATRLSMETLSGMARAAQYIQNALGHNYKLGIFDTHDPNVMKSVARNYGAKPLDNNPVASAYVKAPHPLHWHFDMPGIVVGVFNPEIQLAKADETNLSLGDKTCL